MGHLSLAAKHLFCFSKDDSKLSPSTCNTYSLLCSALATPLLSTFMLSVLSVLPHLINGTQVRMPKGLLAFLHFIEHEQSYTKPSVVAIQMLLLLGKGSPHFRIYSCILIHQQPEWHFQDQLSCLCKD